MDRAKVDAMLAEARSVLSPERYAAFEVRVHEIVAECTAPGPDGDIARQRLDLMLRLGDLDNDKLAELTWVVGAILERRDHSNREEP